MVEMKKCPNCGACQECGAPPYPRPIVYPWPVAPSPYPPYVPTYPNPWGPHWISQPSVTYGGSTSTASSNALH